jgi:hypothetical protein
MSQVKYHKFTRDIPVLFVESFDEFLANVPGEFLSEAEMLSNQSAYFKIFSINETDIRYILFNEGMLKQLFGEANKQVAVDATLALYAGSRKYPKNEQMAYEHALQLLVKEDRRTAFRAVESAFTSKFRMLPESHLTSKDDEPAEKDLDAILFNEAESPAAQQAHKLGLTSRAGGKWYDKRGKYVARTMSGKLVKATGKDVPAPKKKSVSAPVKASPKKASVQKAPSKAPVKSGGQGGRDYELQIAKNIAKSGFGVKGFVPAGANANAPDAMLNINGKQVGVELKMQGAQMGGTSIHMKNGKFILNAIDKKSPMGQHIVKQLNSRRSDVEALIKFLRKQPGNKALTNDWPPGNITTESWQLAVDKGLVKKLNIKIDKNPKEALEFITDHYNKKGIYYINIEGQGMFFMGRNPAGLPVPALSSAGEMHLEIRFTRSGSALRKADNRKVAGVGIRVQGRVAGKIAKRGKDSLYSLDSVESIKKLVQSRKSK